MLALDDGDEADASTPDADYDTDEALPSGLWDPELGVVPGGVDHSVEKEEEEKEGEGV